MIDRSAKAIKNEGLCLQHLCPQPNSNDEEVKIKLNKAYINRYVASSLA